MWVIVKYEYAYYFRHKFIRYYLCILINKIRGKEVEVLENEYFK
jgi:hypothetical protein